ncbi:hypothetical protein C0Q70_03974 [Pomacea canaliculata]|uniref:Ima1 N-terminal domain-containing protein n=1 Tax=Pomacea canaliculata TaxID=400727 RepID=A0A2T7PU76_POMCA|nr:hypothetical protein C0Q70_03974 [Pomacea canaliculata]
MCRPKLSVQVNCWFCNQDSMVPYGNQNCWDCPNCEQYNGFTTDGDYNKPVPAQYTEEINHPITSSSSQFLSHSEVLCSSCQRNQLLKVRQLATFEPLIEDNYDEEISFYRQHLEKVYALCPSCQKAVQQELSRQNHLLQKQYQLVQLGSSSFHEDHNMKEHQARRSVDKHFTVFSISTVITIVCSCLFLWLSISHHLLQDTWIQLPYICHILKQSVPPSACCSCGLIVCVASKLLLGKECIYMQDAVHIMAWLTAFIISIPDIMLFPVHFCTGVPVACVLLLLELLVCLQGHQRINFTFPVIRRCSFSCSASSDMGKEETSSDDISSVSADQHPTKESLNNTPMSQKSSLAKASNKVSGEPEMDRLGEDLSCFQIGTSSHGHKGHPNEIGEDIFKQSASVPKLSSGTPLPRPLIFPAKLDFVSFSKLPEPQQKLHKTQGLFVQNWNTLSQPTESVLLKVPGPGERLNGDLKSKSWWRSSSDVAESNNYKKAAKEKSWFVNPTECDSTTPNLPDITSCQRTHTYRQSSQLPEFSDDEEPLTADRSSISGSIQRPNSGAYYFPKEFYMD